MATTGSAIIAIKKGVTWGTAVALNSAGRGMYLRDTGNLVAIPEQLIDKSIGRIWPECVTQGKRQVDLTLVGDLRFDSPLWEMIALCIGDDDNAALGGGEYVHTMYVQNTAAGLFHTLCVYDGSVVREIASFKVSGFTIKGSAAGIIELTIRGIGNNVVDTGQVNTTLGSVTITTNCLPVPFNVETYINAQGGDALDSGDLVQASEFEFSFDRNLTPDFTTNGTLFETAEPYEVGQPKTSLKLLFPKTPITNYTTGLQDLANGTLRKAQLIIYGQDTGVSNPYSITIQFPSLLVETVESPLQGDNQQIPQTITFMGLHTATAPTGMSTIFNPFRLLLLNLNSVAYDT